VPTRKRTFWGARAGATSGVTGNRHKKGARRGAGRHGKGRKRRVNATHSLNGGRLLGGREEGHGRRGRPKKGERVNERGERCPSGHPKSGNKSQRRRRPFPFPKRELNTGERDLRPRWKGRPTAGGEKKCAASYLRGQSPTCREGHTMAKPTSEKKGGDCTEQDSTKPCRPPRRDPFGENPCLCSASEEECDAVKRKAF